jgi:hypothetical protein
MCSTTSKLTHVLDRSRDVWILPHVLVTDTCARHVWQVDSTTGIMTTLLEPKKKHFFSVSRPTKVCLCVCGGTYQGVFVCLCVLRPTRSASWWASVLALFWFRGLGRFVGSRARAFCWGG